jgi:hypothetical protein
MHTNNGFTPSHTFLESYFNYRAKCEAIKLKPAECEDYYTNKAYHNNILNTKNKTNV